MRGVKKIILLIGALIAITLLWTIVRSHLPSNVEYHGQKIKLSKYYLSYEDYKDDPDNIDTSENARVEQLVTQAPIGRHFADRKEMVAALFELKFPGYGLGFVGTQPQLDGKALELASVEIPRANKDRYLLFEERNGSYALVDDFVAPGASQIMRVREENGVFIYSARSGQTISTHPVPAKDRE